MLQQFRRLQDLQVTIEVRFITLDDDYFEQIGVDFNFNIPTDASERLAIAFNGASTTAVARSSAWRRQLGNRRLLPRPLDVRSNSTRRLRDATVPAFTGLTVDTTPASFGFAILSDIQAFFLIQACQGDDRSNVLQAPKVTLFNGQQAFVSDTSQTPFVTSVIPVVGDFAAAQQPVITVLSEGTSLTVQAVVSPDGRFVRLDGRAVLQPDRQRAERSSSPAPRPPRQQQRTRPSTGTTSTASGNTHVTAKARRCSCRRSTSSR